MTASNGDQCISRDSPKSSLGHPLPDVVVATKDLMVNARVTYTPLAVWKDFHWTCTVRTFAPPVQDRLE
jgi:hypothetical protein